MSYLRLSTLACLLSLALSVGCGDTDDTSLYEQACEFNESRPCECADGAVGVQYCNNALNGFDWCLCWGPDTAEDTAVEVLPEVVVDVVEPAPELVEEVALELVEEICMPSCTGLTCGTPNGCGGLCDCDDGLVCTFETCTGTTCSFDLKPTYCLVDGVCAFDGEEDPSESCRYCDVSMAQYGWVDKADGTPCGNGLVCSGGVCCGQACEDKLCGDDGCGGSCGSCLAHEVCHEGLGRCVAEMVSIQAGASWMGCNKTGACDDDELPYHMVQLPAFEVDATEVTNDQFAMFLSLHGNDCAGTPCADVGSSTFGVTGSEGAYEGKFGKEEWPVAEVSWYGAQAYCTWAGKRLCTEAEWEKAARGGCEHYTDCEDETPFYPWGSYTPTCSYAVINESGQGCGTGDLMDVASKPNGASPYGVYDMAGNAWEWVEDWYSPIYYTTSPDFDPPGPAAGTTKINRGGSFVDYEDSLKSYHRAVADPTITKYSIGFRCCSD